MTQSVYLTNEFIKPIIPLLVPEWNIVPAWELQSNSDKDKIVALATTVWDKIDYACLSQFPNLKVICHLGIGTDNIDISYLQEHHINLLSQPQAGIHDTSELALALMLTLARKIIPNHLYTQNNFWIEKKTRYIGNHLFEKKLGLVGLGKIGLTIAQFATAFGMNIGYTARTPKDNSYTFYQSVETLASISDYLVICCSASPDTYHLINKSVLKNLGEKGYLINVARGSIVDYVALIDALKQKMIAGAALDVFPEEPEVPAELRKLNNVVLSPHMGSSTRENLESMFQLQAKQLNSYLRDL